MPTAFPPRGSFDGVTGGGSASGGGGGGNGGWGDGSTAAATVPAAAAAASITAGGGCTRRNVLRAAVVVAGGAVGMATADRGAAGGPPPAATAATATTTAAGEAAAPLVPVAADYDAYAADYDALDGPSALSRAFGLDDARRSLVARARGDVLELAVGTGLNLPLYGPPPGASAMSVGGGGGGSGVGSDGDSGSGSGGEGGGSGRRPLVTSITGVDLSTGMLAVAARRASTTAIPVSLLAADATRTLPFPDASFDTILDTYSLCTFGAPAEALAEAARLLRPGGAVLLLEHVRSGWGLLGAYQDATAGAVAATSKGCMWNQDVQGAAATAGFRVVAETRYAGGTVAALELRLP